MKLENKTAYVAGSGRGIGRAIALKLASEGANLVLNDLDAVPVAEVAAEIKAMGRKSVSVADSVTEDGFAERFIQTGLDAFGGLDIIVNDAGYTWDSMIAKMTDNQFDAMMDVHVKAPFRIPRAAAPYIRGFAEAEAAEGREVFRKLVSVSSIAGLGGNPGQANHSSGKAVGIGRCRTQGGRLV